MNHELKHSKATLRIFMRDQYSDDRLVMLLDHARSGKLAHMACCCVYGIVSANHTDGELRSYGEFDKRAHGGEPVMTAVSWAYNRLDIGVGFDDDMESDRIRRARLIPMILAEQKRRRALLPEVTEDGHDLWLTHSSEGFYVEQ